jgi:tRNA-uridine 2-sulfurtransferase
MSKVYNDNSKTTIAVAMSGGVDSSVSAALLKEQGYNVLGFFMKNWDDSTKGLKKSDCPWMQDREDAMRVAAKLDIPFKTLDFEKEYKDMVLDYFFKEYEKGRTPNPDIMCNSQIKFGVFLEKALSLGADMIATGHYVKTNKKHELLKGVDENKDQSYFLYRLNKEQLSKAMFPVGNYDKPKVRKLAEKFELPNFDKKDSQGVCFIGHIDLQEFLSQKIKEKPGKIVTTEGKKIGKHDGLFWYTTGQRRGIKVGGSGPYYVLEKDFEKNELIVTNDEKDKRLFSASVEIEDVNWISGITPSDSPLAGGEVLECRIRYREILTKCKITKKGENYKVKFEIPQWAVASGQSVVFYDGDVCLGGGIIK